MNTIFVDTSFLLALELSKDVNHGVALAHWQHVLASAPRFLTTSYIFDEVVTFFNNRGYHAKAVEVGERLLRSPSVQFVHVDEPLFAAGWAYFPQHQDKDYSLTDCLSFLVMRKFGVPAALSFDHHFAQAGFIRQP